MTSTKSSTLVTENAIRGVLREFFQGGASSGRFDPGSNRMKSLAHLTTDPWVLMYQTSPSTDPNMCQDAPLNPEIVPQNKRELEVSLRALIKDLDNVEVPDLFKKIKELVDELLEDEGSEEMKDKVEEAIRSQVRKIIRESRKNESEAPELTEVRKAVRKAIMEALPGSSGLAGAVDYYGEDENDTSKPTPKKKARTVGDVGGVPWEQLKAVSGHTGKGTSGIEQYVYGKPTHPGGPPEGGLVQRFANIIMSQAPEVQDYVDDETQGKRKGMPQKGVKQMGRGLIVRQLVDEYINYLASSGVLDPEEVEFMKDNPDVIETRPLFHNMLQKTVDQLESQEDPTDDAEFVVNDLKKYLRDLKSKFGE